MIFYSHVQIWSNMVFAPFLGLKFFFTFIYTFSSMKVICLEEEAFFALVEEVVERIKSTQNIPQEKWIDGTEAMNLLKIKSKTTLQKLRDEGEIRFSQPQKKIILYDRDSLHEYLERNAKETF